MKVTVLSVFLFVAGLISTRGAVLTITGFGSSAMNPSYLSENSTVPDDLQGQWHDDGTSTTTGTQTATAIDLTNVSNETGSPDDPNGIYADLTADGRSPVDVGTNTAQMVLTAALISAPKYDDFVVSLFDANDAELDYDFHYSSFASSGETPVTVIADLSGSMNGNMGAAFDGTVASYAVTPEDIQNLSPNTLSIDFFDLGVEDAIPEPSSYAFLLLAAGGVTFARRHARVLPTARL